MVAEIPLPTLRSILKLDNVPQFILEQAAHKTDVEVQLALANNIQTSGKTLGMISIGKAFELHNIGHETRTFKGYSSGIQTEAHSPDGYFIARSTPDTNGQIELIDKQTEKKICFFSGHKAAVQSLSFSADGKLLASRSAEDFKYPLNK